jgi:hypothetical protein
MVFGTRLLTPDGCSVMVQVITNPIVVQFHHFHLILSLLQAITGTDCGPSPRSSNATMDLESLPLIVVKIPEKVGLAPFTNSN